MMEVRQTILFMLIMEKWKKSDVLLPNGVMYVVDNVILPSENGSDVGSTSNNHNDGFNGENNVQGTVSNKKLIVGTVLGAICGGIVVSLFSCMLYKWYRAQKNSKLITASTNNNNKR